MATRRVAQRTRRFVPVLASALLVVLPSVAWAQLSPGERLPVRKVTLDNGMRVLILERSGAPTISFVMQYGVGGVDEAPGKTGIAHVLEHLLFKGTTTVGTRDYEAERALLARIDGANDAFLAATAAGDDIESERHLQRIAALEDSARAYVVSNEFDEILTRAGARGLNATTTSEATTYFVELPANRAELFFALEGDRLTNPVFREFYAERDVVIEERRQRVEASPGGSLYEAHLAAAFTEHPYGVPVVGYMDDLRALSRRDVIEFYRRHYGAGNAVLTVVGAVDADQVEAWAREYLSTTPGGDPPPPVRIVEPEQMTERRVELPWDAQPQLRIGWHVPAVAHDDAPALAVLTSILTGSRTSRLHRRLVLQDRITTAVFSSMGPGSRYPRLFQIDLTPRSPHRPQEVEAAVYEEIQRLIVDGPEPEEVERVRNQIEAGATRRLQSNLGLALQLAESETLFGDWRETFRSNARLAAVTPEQVRQVAERYLRADNRTVATLVPEGRP